MERFDRTQRVQALQDESTPSGSQLRFDVYRLDLDNAQLWRGAQALPLTAKALDVLSVLMTQAGKLVRKETLFQSVWPGAAVSDQVLTNCISELRKALGETAQQPRFIQTVHRRGYRFLAPVAVLEPASPETPAPSGSAAPALFVGRASELAVLHQHLAQAQRGQRQVVLIGGGAGLGKTSVVDAFLASLPPEAQQWVLGGQCLDQYGAGEAYLPLLDALARLGRRPGCERLLDVLRQYAPTWVGQLPALFDAAEREAAQRQGLGATPQRMLREAAEFLEAVSAAQPLILVLEDLHWSDQATIALLGWLARRQERAQLLILGTYRPVEVIIQDHPLRTLKHELALHGQCVDLHLDGLLAADVAAYLAARLPGSEADGRLPEALYRRTDGHPLFLVSMVDELVRRGLVQQTAGRWAAMARLDSIERLTPENLRQLVAQQFEGLSPEQQRVLEAASVMGLESAVAAIAAGANMADAEVETQCATLARQGQFLRLRGVETWPDGTLTERCRFRHVLYQQVVYEHIPMAQRLRLHLQIGERLEAGYGAQAAARAAELAMHFARGRAVDRALPYWRQAAENALQRAAHAEAMEHLNRALEALPTLPGHRERLQHGVALHTLRGVVLSITKGFAAPETMHAYTRTRELSQQLEDPSGLFAALWGLWLSAVVREELSAVRKLGDELMRLAERASPQTPYRKRAHNVQGITHFWHSEWSQARTHFEKSLALDAASQQDVLDFYGQDTEVSARSYLACVLCFLGYPDQGLRRSQEALAAARELSHPHSLALALFFAVWTHWLRGEAAAMQAHNTELVALASREGFPYWAAQAASWRSWLLTVQGQPAEGTALFSEGVAARRARGVKAYPKFATVLMVDAYHRVGQAEKGLQLMAEAQAGANLTQEGFHDVALLRLKGELLQQQTPPEASQAEDCLQQALALAQRQDARWLELRIALCLSRLRHEQGQEAAAYALLAPVYQGFTEGFDTADLQEAKALLDACER